MKTKTKALVLSFCAVLLVVTTAMVTMAFLTSTDSVKNTFTVGKVAITLDEAAVKTDGTYKSDVHERVKANEYKLIPGHTYIKDPVVHVDEQSEDCWLFVKLENGLKDVIADATIETQMANNGWTLVAGQTNVYAYNAKVSANEDVEVFKSFTVKGTATDLSTYKDQKIIVTACAVQADGFDTAAAAFSAVTFG
ncbi:MAG: SipW-dependent-type signal peptide-containing protein [Clostridiales bacterium]|nr:SipW-dependent-type signal peptide-containing protein [Clostridiales bacterium]